MVQVPCDEVHLRHAGPCYQLLAQRSCRQYQSLNEELCFFFFEHLALCVFLIPLH